MINFINPIEPAAKALAATALSQTLSFCMERKYLEGISLSSSANPFHLEAIDSTLKDEAYWLRIKQVGKPLRDSAEDCFTAIQKILYSCFLPNTIQLLFWWRVMVKKVECMLDFVLFPNLSRQEVMSRG